MGALRIVVQKSESPSRQRYVEITLTGEKFGINGGSPIKAIISWGAEIPSFTPVALFIAGKGDILYKVVDNNLEFVIIPTTTIDYASGTAISFASEIISANIVYRNSIVTSEYTNCCL